MNSNYNLENSKRTHRNYINIIRCVHFSNHANSIRIYRKMPAKVRDSLDSKNYKNQ